MCADRVESLLVCPAGFAAFFEDFTKSPILGLATILQQSLEATRPVCHSSPLSRPLLHPPSRCPVDARKKPPHPLLHLKIDRKSCCGRFHRGNYAFFSRWEFLPLLWIHQHQTQPPLPSFLAFPAANLCSLANCRLLTYFADWAACWWCWWPHSASSPHLTAAPAASAVDPPSRRRRVPSDAGADAGTTWNRRVFPATVVCCGLLQQRDPHRCSTGRRSRSCSNPRLSGAWLPAHALCNSYSFVCLCKLPTRVYLGVGLFCEFEFIIWKQERQGDILQLVLNNSSWHWL